MQIETERLLLRPMRVADIDCFLELHAAPEVSRWVPYPDRAEALERLENDQRQWEERGHGMMAVLDRESGRFIGRSGLRHWPQFDETEVSWVFAPSYWGRGLASEAASACVQWAFASLLAPYVTAMIVPSNARSISVANRLGMTPLRDDVLFGHRVVVHAVRRAGLD